MFWISLKKMGLLLQKNSVMRRSMCKPCNQKIKRFVEKLIYFKYYLELFTGSNKRKNVKEEDINKKFHT